MAKNVPEVVARRLPRYYRYLGEQLERGVERISSRTLSEMMKVTASQIRQDLNCFGGFGQQGYGYNVYDLHEKIGEILGLNNCYHIIVVGAGNVGRAVANYTGFRNRGFMIEALFDNDPHLIGGRINGLPILDAAQLREYCAVHRPHIAAIAVPRSAAESVLTELEECGILGIWNFSHADLNCRIPVETVHMSDSLMTLSYRISHRTRDDNKGDEQ